MRLYRPAHGDCGSRETRPPADADASGHLKSNYCGTPICSIVSRTSSSTEIVPTPKMVVSTRL